MSAEDTSRWKRCSSCKKDIDFSTIHWVCSVSTCTRKRTGLVFCSVACWEVHLPMMRHREAFAVEERSPSRAAWEHELAQEAAAQSEGSSSQAPSAGPASSHGAASSPRAASSSSPPAAPPSGPGVRRRVAALETASGESAHEPAQDDEPEELDQGDLSGDILVVASKLKKYIRARSGMNTSDAVMAVLSDHLRAICNEAIRNAGKDGRKTVLERDVPRPPLPGRSGS